MHRVSISSSCSSPKREAVSTVKEKHARWSQKESHSQSKPHWRSPAGEDAGQSLPDKWKSSKTPGHMERDLPRDGCVGVSLGRKDAHLEQELQRKRQKRVFLKQDDRNRSARRKTRGQRKKHACLKDTLKKLRKEREEENEARALLEEMQQNLEEAHARASETERKLYRELGEYTHSWEKALERPHYIMDKIWQSNDTKTMNPNKDFEELLNKAQQTGRFVRPKQQDSGRKKKKKTIRNRDHLRPKV